MEIDKSKIKKLLCIKPRGIGDIVLSTIIIDNLVSYFQGVKIDYLTESFAKPCLEDNPNINKILIMGKKEFPLSVALRIRKEKYDLLLDLWSNPRTAQITFLSGVKYRVGFAYRGRKYAYNIRATSERGAYHSAEHNLELIKAINVPIVSKNVQYFISPSDKEFAQSVFQSYFEDFELVTGIIPSGGWESKRCDASKWVEICKGLREKYNTKFLILWGPKDKEDADYIFKNLGDSAKLAPETNIKQMSALINFCNLVIANDSGPMHISAALGKPTIGIFGPTDPVAHGPYSPTSDYVIKEDLFCIVCNKLKCPYGHECMLELEVDKVLKKVSSLVQ
jgi:lipopolysaccharide heptosyltransferase II